MDEIFSSYGSTVIILISQGFAFSREFTLLKSKEQLHPPTSSNLLISFIFNPY